MQNNTVVIALIILLTISSFLCFRGTSERSAVAFVRHGQIASIAGKIPLQSRDPEFVPANQQEERLFRLIKLMNESQTDQSVLTSLLGQNDYSMAVPDIDPGTQMRIIQALSTSLKE